MRKDIHPEYRPVVFMDTSTGYQFLSGSTKRSNETVEFEGETYPLIRVEISSDSHPFYTGRQKFTQADGRVDRFNKKSVLFLYPKIFFAFLNFKICSQPLLFLFSEFNKKLQKSDDENLTFGVWFICNQRLRTQMFKNKIPYYL